MLITSSFLLHFSYVFGFLRWCLMSFCYSLFETGYHCSAGWLYSWTCYVIKDFLKVMILELPPHTDLHSYRSWSNKTDFPRIHFHWLLPTSAESGSYFVAQAGLEPLVLYWDYYKARLTFTAGIQVQKWLTRAECEFIEQNEKERIGKVLWFSFRHFQQLV